MSHAFKNYPAKPAFGSNRESINAGDYILRKKARSYFCTSSNCPQKYILNTQGELNLLRTAKYLDVYKHKLPFNKNNLNINLVTKLDLKDVCVIQDPSGNVCPTTIRYGEIPNFYVRYIIDPNGKLFGNTECGINNFLNYLVYNPRYNNPNPGHIDNL
jgi:hypothetical protein